MEKSNLKKYKMLLAMLIRGDHSPNRVPSISQNVPLEGNFKCSTAFQAFARSQSQYSMLCCYVSIKTMNFYRCKHSAEKCSKLSANFAKEML